MRQKQIILLLITFLMIISGCSKTEPPKEGSIDIPPPTEVDEVEGTDSIKVDSAGVVGGWSDLNYKGLLSYSRRYLEEDNLSMLLPPEYSFEKISSDVYKIYKESDMVSDGVALHLTLGNLGETSPSTLKGYFRPILMDSMLYYSSKDKVLNVNVLENKDHEIIIDDKQKVFYDKSEPVYREFPTAEGLVNPVETSKVLGYREIPTVEYYNKTYNNEFVTLPTIVYYGVIGDRVFAVSGASNEANEQTLYEMALVITSSLRYEKVTYPIGWLGQFTNEQVVSGINFSLPDSAELYGGSGNSKVYQLEGNENYAGISILVKPYMFDTTQHGYFTPVLNTKSVEDIAGMLFKKGFENHYTRLDNIVISGMGDDINAVPINYEGGIFHMLVSNVKGAPNVTQNIIHKMPLNAYTLVMVEAGSEAQKEGLIISVVGPENKLNLLEEIVYRINDSVH